VCHGQEATGGCAGRKELALPQPGDSSQKLMVEGF
jgi:hypothetical protein